MSWRRSRAWICPSWPDPTSTGPTGHDNPLSDDTLSTLSLPGCSASRRRALISQCCEPQPCRANVTAHGGGSADRVLTVPNLLSAIRLALIASSSTC